MVCVRGAVMPSPNASLLAFTLLVLLPTQVDVASVHTQSNLQQQHSATVTLTGGQSSTRLHHQLDKTQHATGGLVNVLPALVAPHGTAGGFSDAAASFSEDSKNNRSAAVRQCVQTVDLEVRAFVAEDGSDEFALPKLEIWCNVYNVRVAENRMRKQPAQAVLFNDCLLYTSPSPRDRG